MATFAGMTILQTFFPDADEDILESVLDAYDGDVDKARNFIEKSGSFKENSAAKKAAKPKKNEATKKTVTQSAGMLALQKEFPDLEVDTLKATLMAFDDDPKEASAYLHKHTKSMKPSKAIKPKEQKPTEEPAPEPTKVPDDEESEDAESLC